MKVKFVLVIISHPTYNPTDSEINDFLVGKLPELSDSNAQVEKYCTTGAITPLLTQNVAIDIFGKEIADDSKYTYRTISFLMNGGEGRIFVVYQKREEKQTKSTNRKLKENIKYFDVPVSGTGVFLCSDNECPCTDQKNLTPGVDGCLYISQELVDMRKDCISWSSAKQKLEDNFKNRFGSNYIGFAANGIIDPIFLCETGARLRKLDLEISKADAKFWAENEKVPFRPSPLVSEKKISKTSTSILKKYKTLPHILIGLIWSVFSIWLCVSEKQIGWMFLLIFLGFVPYLSEIFLCGSKVSK